MTKEQARKKLALAASRQGLKVQMKSGKVKDAVRILNASGKVVAEGTLALDASRNGYVNADVQKTVNQINTKLGKKRSMNSSRRRKMNCARTVDIVNCAAFKELFKEVSLREYLEFIGADPDYEGNYRMQEDMFDAWFIATEPKLRSLQCVAMQFKNFESVEVETLSTNAMVINGYDNWSFDSVKAFENWANSREWDGYMLEASRRTNASKRRKMNSACSGKKKMNASDDEYIQDDAEFVEDVESIVTDEQGNEIVVEEMLVVQDPETNEISLFVPTEEDETVPENVEVIGEVVTADDETTLDSSRKRVKMKASKRTRR